MQQIKAAVRCASGAGQCLPAATRAVVQTPHHARVRARPRDALSLYSLSSLSDAASYALSYGSPYELDAEGPSESGSGSFGTVPPSSPSSPATSAALLGVSFSSLRTWYGRGVCVASTTSVALPTARYVSRTMRARDANIAARPTSVLLEGPFLQIPRCWSSSQVSSSVRLFLWYSMSWNTI